jgi:hypothetical protein
MIILIKTMKIRLLHYLVLQFCYCISYSSTKPTATFPARTYQLFRQTDGQFQENDETERRTVVVTIRASYSNSPRFDSWPGGWLS